MANYFPPVPAYPKGYDNEYTLFEVFNTSETVTTSDNFPWASEINIKPVDADKAEIWATNGFANIEGELFYYDAVDYDINGRINKFKRCARNLGGTHTKFNAAGSEVRGFVIAEHHNQLVDAIVKTEKFIGENFSTDKTTLDWRIRNLQQLPVIFDDHTCPQFTFDFSIVSSDPASGILAEYNIVIDGTFTNFRLDFGDGEFTTTATRGSHRYAPNATIDPIVTISNNRCAIVQTPVNRTIVTEPTTGEETIPFEIKIPTLPDLPSLQIPAIPLPSNIVSIPPIVFPCLDLGPIGSFNVPSVIVIDSPINIPSVINVISPNIPSVINIVGNIPTLITITPVNIPTLITVVGDVSFPSLITFGPIPNIPSLISFGPIPYIPSLISFGPIPFIPSLISFGPIPNIPTKIEFGPVPVIPSLIEFGPIPNIPTKIEFGPVPFIPTLIEFGLAPFIPTLIAFDPVNIPTKIEFGHAPYIPTLIEFGHAPYIPTKIFFGPAPFVPSYITFGEAPFIPSHITFGPAPFIPTRIDFGPAPFIPSHITFGEAPFIPSHITFGPAPYIPSHITFGPAPYIPSHITFGGVPELGPICFCAPPQIGPVYFAAPPSLGPIYFAAPPSLGPISFGPAPSLSVVWGTPPTCSCTVTIQCPTSGPTSPSTTPFRVSDPFGFDNFDPLEVQVSDVGIPSEIFLRVPEIPDIKVIHDIPAVIRVEAPVIPDIKIIGPETPLPVEIKIVAEDIPSSIELIAQNIPKSIAIDAQDLPRSIKLEVPDIPAIKIDASSIPSTIQVVGIPSAIELIGAPSEIKLVLPENPEVELVYKGAPIDVKINLDISRLTGEDGNSQCVAIVPCNPKQ